MATTRDLAEEFLVGLVQAFGYEAQTVVGEGDDGAVEIAVDGADLGLLIGPRGQTMSAIQDLVRVAVSHRGDDHPRLRVDIGGYRARRREALMRFAEKVATDVRASGKAKALEPMPSPDRKIVHDALVGFEGVSTSSEGEEPNRRVVISPLSADNPDSGHDDEGVSDDD